MLGKKSAGKDRTGSKRGAKIPVLVSAVLNYKLEMLASLQSRYPCRLCLLGRAVPPR